MKMTTLRALSWRKEGGRGGGGGGKVSSGEDITAATRVVKNVTHGPQLTRRTCIKCLLLDYEIHINAVFRPRPPTCAPVHTCKHQDYPGMCWIAKQNKSFPDGGQWQEPNCMRATCLSYKSSLYVEYATCGLMGVEPGCETVQDLTLDYPSCCPTLSCPNLDNEALKGDEYEEFTNWIGEYYDQPLPVA
nr:uncharacterized protein LOC128690654 isoform X1 [Cherax quadricarinatus]